MGIALNSWADNDSFILDNVSIKGLEGLQSDVVKSRIGYKKGSYITPEDTNQIINNLYGTGFFNSVDLYRKGSNLLLMSKKGLLLLALTLLVIKNSKKKI